MLDAWVVSWIVAMVWSRRTASAEALAEAAVACLSDDAWRTRAATESRPNALKYFAIDSYIERLLTLYEGPEVGETGAS